MTKPVMERGMETFTDRVIFVFALLPLWVLWAESMTALQGSPMMMGVVTLLFLGVFFLIGLQIVFAYVLASITLLFCAAALIGFFLEQIFMYLSTSLITIPAFS